MMSCRHRLENREALRVVPGITKDSSKIGAVFDILRHDVSPAKRAAGRISHDGHHWRRRNSRQLQLQRCKQLVRRAGRREEAVGEEPSHESAAHRVPDRDLSFTRWSEWNHIHRRSAVQHSRVRNCSCVVVQRPRAQHFAELWDESGFGDDISPVGGEMLISGDMDRHAQTRNHSARSRIVGQVIANVMRVNDSARRRANAADRSQHGPRLVLRLIPLAVGH